MAQERSEIQKVWEPTLHQCYKFLYAFCEVMGYNPKDAEFIGRIPDPFGIVQIGDDSWKMSDINYVLSEYDNWVAKYGEKLQQVIRDWVAYSEGVHERNYSIVEYERWHKVSEGLPKDGQLVLCTRTPKEGAVMLTARFKKRLLFGNKYEYNRFVRSNGNSDCNTQILRRIAYWKPAYYPDTTPNTENPTNLWHWLLGWRPNNMSSAEYRAMREKELKDAMARVERLKEEINNIDKEHF